MRDMSSALRSLLFCALVASLDAALLRPSYASKAPPQMLFGRQKRAAAREAAAVEAVNVEAAADALRSQLRLEVVSSFVAATEAGDATAAMALCTEDFFYKTHRATTEGLAAAEERLHTKVPAPSKVTYDLDECSVDECGNPNTIVRTIVVKPIPFVTVTVRQEFETAEDPSGCVKIRRAEFIKQ